ncbi:hypothetical protein ABZU94_07140 [Streptomyces mirabilis]|uniref:hypothetical protein n=1 Tax=Streptomyces sp. NPDC005388 TaxID=3156717 RepID=UPI0033A08C5D
MTTTMTTRTGFNAFLTGMCEHFDQLPDGLGVKPLHVTQAALDPDTFLTHRLDSGGHHIVYDGRQVDPMQVRQFLAVYAAYTEGPLLDGLRDAYYTTSIDAYREILRIVVHEIDRTQDPDGAMDRVLELFTQAAAEKSGVRARTGVTGSIRKAGAR